MINGGTKISLTPTNDEVVLRVPILVMPSLAALRMMVTEGDSMFYGISKTCLSSKMGVTLRPTLYKARMTGSGFWRVAGETSMLCKRMVLL